MFTAAKTGYAEFIGNFRTERGIFRAMQRDVRKEIQAYEESRKSLEQYGKVVSECRIDEVRKELEGHYTKAVKKEVDALKVLFDYVVKENHKILKGIVDWRDDLMKTAQNEIEMHAKKAESSKNMSSAGMALGNAAQKTALVNVIIKITNDLLDKYERSINSKLSSVAGIDSLTIRKADLLDTESLLRDIAGKLIRERKDVSVEKKAKKTSAKDIMSIIDEALQTGGSEAEIERFAGKIDGSKNNLFQVYDQLLQDSAATFNEVIAFIVRLQDDIQNMTSNAKPFDIRDSAAHPPSIIQLRADVPQGLGYPDVPGEEIQRSLSQELERLHKLLSTFIAEARIQLSEVEGKKLARAA